MFRFDNFLEQWAMAYKLLSHKPKKEDKHKTFYRISMIDGNSEFIRNANTCPPHGMGYVTHIDAEMTEKGKSVIDYRHVIFMMVKQADGGLSKTLANDEESAATARAEADQMVRDLLSYLSTFKAIAGGKMPSSEQLKVLEKISKNTEAGDTGWTYTDDGRVVMTAEAREALRGMQLDRADWSTLPTKINGWQVCGLTLEQIEPRNVCIVPDKYNEE